MFKAMDHCRKRFHIAQYTLADDGTNAKSSRMRDPLVLGAVAQSTYLWAANLLIGCMTLARDPLGRNRFVPFTRLCTVGRLGRSRYRDVRVRAFPKLDLSSTTNPVMAVRVL